MQNPAADDPSATQTGIALTPRKVSGDLHHTEQVYARKQASQGICQADAS